MHIKIILSILASLVAFISYAPYIRDLHNGKTKPHAYSWLIWALLAYIVGIAQLSNGGGGGAWTTIISATICLYIAIVAFKGASIAFTRSDNISLSAVIVAIPIWIITKQALLAVILITIIDLIGFWPTVRKSFNSSHHETLSTYWLAIIKNALAITALQDYNSITLIYPISLVLADGLCIALFLSKAKLGITLDAKEKP